MPTRKKPVVRLRKYDRAEQVLIIEFLTDRIKAIEHSLEQCRQMARLESNEYTVAQVRFYEHSQSNMLWLLNTLSFFKRSKPGNLGQAITKLILKRLRKQDAGRES